jgi:DNA-binding LacI/PurR family transcriptional regulator
MIPLNILSPSQQVAAHLRAELQRGVWRDELPGAPQLAGGLGVDRKTVDAALRLLEEEGWLDHRGKGRRRRIIKTSNLTTPSLRLAILLGEASDAKVDYIVELKHRLEEAGHSPFFAKQSMLELGMRVSRIAKVVERIDAGAWIILAGSREVLEWFADRPVPTFALFGRRDGLRMAGVGPDTPSAYASATKTLIELGHRRIVVLARPRRRLPEPGQSEQAFLDQLAAHGLPVSDYNLPAWEETIPDFYKCLESLFRVTPPTALIIDEVSPFIAAQQFLARRRLRVPEDVSLVCTDTHSALEWCLPKIAHIHCEVHPVVRRVVRWAANVSSGRSDLRQTLTLARFIRGGTIGPAPRF